ncbi:MAG: hypothetical protein AB8C84_11830 [Oligoflexales bacterium]
MHFLSMLVLMLALPLQSQHIWSVSAVDEHGALWKKQNQSFHGHKNILKMWKQRKTGVFFLHKNAKPYSIRAEAVGANLFSKMKIPVPNTHINLENSRHPSLMIEFYSGLKRPSSLDYKKNDKVLLRAFLLDLLLYNYDRHRLNIRVQKSGELLFFDHGAGLTSKAQGGSLDYSEIVDFDQVKKVMTLAVNKKRPVNLGYAGWVDWQRLRKGELKFSNPEEVRKALEEFQTVLTDDVICEDILKPVFSTLSLDESRAEISKRLSSLKNIFLSVASRDEARARKTFHKILDDYNGNQWCYFSKTMASRRDQIVKIVTAALP